MLNVQHFIRILHISVSLDNILTPVICVMSGFLQQKLGPLRVLQLSCLPYTLAWVLAALATQHSTLYVSRSALVIIIAYLTTKTRLLAGLTHSHLYFTIYVGST